MTTQYTRSETYMITHVHRAVAGPKRPVDDAGNLLPSPPYDSSAPPTHMTLFDGEGCGTGGCPNSGGNRALIILPREDTDPAFFETFSGGSVTFGQRGETIVEITVPDPKGSDDPLSVYPHNL